MDLSVCINWLKKVKIDEKESNQFHDNALEKLFILSLDSTFVKKFWILLRFCNPLQDFAKSFI